MTKNKLSVNKYIIVTGVTVILFAIQFLFSRLGWLVASLFDYYAIDQDSLFAEVTVHHIVQLLCSFLVIGVLYKIKNIDRFKLRPKYDSKGLKYTVIFCSVLLVYYTVVYIAGTFFHSINTFDYDLNARNIIGTLGFQLFLSGPSEEVLFRSLPITVLLYCMQPANRKDRVIAVVIAAFLFGLGHINIMTFYIPWFQVCYAFVLGLAYGFVLIKSNSIIYPMIMHSLSNVISVGGCYLYMLFMK